jgi:hypothetical protein
MSHKTAPLVTAAICTEDRDALIEFFHASFHGQVFEPASGESVARPFAEFRFQNADQCSHVSVDREAFADWLLEHVRQFGTQRAAQLSLVAVSPTDRDRIDGPWQGKWALRMFGSGDGMKGFGQDSTAEVSDRPDTAATAPRREVVIRGQFRCDELPSDFVRDRQWINEWNIEHVAIAESTHILMEEVSARSGLEIDHLHDNWSSLREKHLVTPGGVYACDFNSDGHIDLLVTDRGAARLYSGAGDGQFQDVSFLLPWERGKDDAVVFADLDNDGDEDLVLGEVILENRGGRFVRAGQIPMPRGAAAFSVADYDRDGLVDLYVSYAAPEPLQASGRVSWIDDETGPGNRLLRNLQGFRFEDVTDRANAAAGKRSTFSSVWLDIDDDGWPDLYVINELGNNVLLRNEQNGSFSQHHIGPSCDGFTMGIAAGDVDGDGRTDLYLGNMYSKAGQRIIANLPPSAYSDEIMTKLRGFVSGNSLFLNRGDLQFDDRLSRSVAAVGWAYGPELLDLDADGFLDIYSTCGFISFSRDEPDG